MSMPDLSQVSPGFAVEAAGSQQVFRASLHAMAHPGRWTAVEADAAWPTGCRSAAALLMLALVDADTPVWLSPSLRASAGPWLRFHTGCPLVQEPARCAFAWIAPGDAAPPLDALPAGTDEDPDRSATCILELASAQGDGADVNAGGERFELRGPGIQGTQCVTVRGLPEGFAKQWIANTARFPRGVDVFLATSDSVMGLPRTTRMLLPEEA